MFNILVVEDDERLNRLFCTVLERDGYRAIPAGNGTEALEVMDREMVDLIISDIMMPGMDGYELIRSLREADYDIPVLIITAKDNFEAMQQGFAAGTDDYMVKPVDVGEMLLRVGALMRRAKITTDRQIVLGDTVVDFDAQTIRFGETELLLPKKEFGLLYKLISYPNKTFTRQQLMDELWGMDSDTDERTVDVHINRLREKIKDCRDFEIITVRGLGYKAVKTV